MKRIKKLNNKGFSLIELLICLAISSFVILAAYSLVLVGTKSYHSNNRDATLQKEASFTNNIIAEAVRNGICEETYIVYRNSHKDIEIHTGKNVICYDESEKTLYIYEEVAGANYWPATPSNQNIVSKYVKAFNAGFQVNKKDRELVPLDMANTIDDTIKATEAVKDTTSGNFEKTDIIKFEMTFEVKDRSDTTEVMYQIRN